MGGRVPRKDRIAAPTSAKITAARITDVAVAHQLENDHMPTAIVHPVSASAHPAYTSPVY